MYVYNIITTRLIFPWLLVEISEVSSDARILYSVANQDEIIKATFVFC